MDGFTIGQRKVMFTCFERNVIDELTVSKLDAYMHSSIASRYDEASFISTIVKLAQNFVGSNNINLLKPIGYFGTRVDGGKDAVWLL
jgi:DNA topoisomerase-2